MAFTERLQHAWNAFFNKDPTGIDNLDNSYKVYDFSTGYSSRPDRFSLGGGKNQSIISAIYNRIALDVSSVEISHVKLDDEGRYSETLKSGLNECLTLAANMDQTGRAFIQDIVMSMFDEGCVAVVPIDTTINPNISGSYDIQTMRTGQILQWYPSQIKVRLYNEKTGNKEDIFVNKTNAAIIENPFYAVMNEHNSTLKRLTRKLALLDIADDNNCSGKLNMLIQLPYTIKNANRRNQAENRRKEIETQLATSKYGIAYTDGTEKVTQLNGSIDNNIQSEVEYLTKELFNQLGLTMGVFDGSANDSEMNNYLMRTIEPILAAITDEMTRKFLTKTARTQKQRIVAINDPFKFVPTNQLAETVDKFTRNEILTSNEVRQIIGIKPATDPNADVLRNKNVSLGKDQLLFDKEGNKINTNIGQETIKEETVNESEV